MLTEGAACFAPFEDNGEEVGARRAVPLPDFTSALATLRNAVEPFLKILTKDQDAAHAEPLKELDVAIPLFKADVNSFLQTVSKQQAGWGQQKTTNGELKKAVEHLAPLAETSHDLVKQTDLLYKPACRLIETCENECDARDSDAWPNRDITRARKAADEARAI